MSSTNGIRESSLDYVPISEKIGNIMDDLILLFKQKSQDVLSWGKKLLQALQSLKYADKNSAKNEHIKALIIQNMFNSDIVGQIFSNNKLSNLDSEAFLSVERFIESLGFFTEGELRRICLDVSLYKLIDLSLEDFMLFVKIIEGKAPLTWNAYLILKDYRVAYLILVISNEETLLKFISQFPLNEQDIILDGINKIKQIKESLPS